MIKINELMQAVIDLGYNMADYHYLVSYFNIYAGLSGLHLNKPTWYEIELEKRHSRRKLLKDLVTSKNKEKLGEIIERARVGLTYELDRYDEI